MKYLHETFHYFQLKLRSFGSSEPVGFLHQQMLHFQGRVKSIDIQQIFNQYVTKLRAIDYAYEIALRRKKFKYFRERVKSFEWSRTMEFLRQESILFLWKVKSLGFTTTMDDYEKRKLGIFNQLNFFQFLTGVIVPLSVLLGHDKLSATAWFVACLPALTSLLVLKFNSLKKYDHALITYFLVYPFVTGIVYLGGMNLGIELHFILFGILSVFFIQQLSHMLFSLGFSMVSYFILAVVLKSFLFELETANLFFYLFNQVLAIIFIFYGLYLIKKENTGYQFSILSKNRDLHKKNMEIQKQKREIAEKAVLLKRQTSELTELNSLKNKLFSVIAHDLKSPMYALRNLFRNMHQYDLPAEEIKTMVPDVVNDLNFTVGLMDNLLQWAKSQMTSGNLKMQNVDISKATEEVLRLLRLQSETKQIYIENKIDKEVYVLADKDMINLVLRNLISNAIKFTPSEGSVIVSVNEMSSFVEVSVHDTGMGISPEALSKINQNDYYTTKGTESESGTGLGLMLCKEFLVKNGGQLHIESEPGKGSVFSFTLRRAD